MEDSKCLIELDHVREGYQVVDWIQSFWIRSSGRLLWTRWWTFVFEQLGGFKSNGCVEDCSKPM